MNNHTRLSINEKVGYGLGDTAFNLYFQMYINFLLFFYTNIFGDSCCCSRDAIYDFNILGYCQ